MISTSECRRLLDNPDLSDKEVEDIRDALYGFSHALIDAYIEERMGTHPDHLDSEHDRQNN